MSRERILCNVEIDPIEPNVLLIKPFHNKGFDDNSVYEFKFPNIKAKNGSILKAQKIKYVTKPTIMYASIDDIKNKLGDIDINDEIILYHLKESSRLAEIIVQKAFEKRNLSFSKEDLQQLRQNIEEIKNEKTLIWCLVVYKTCYECISALYLTMVTKPNSVKEVLSDLSKEINYDLSALKDLLDDYKHKFDEILDETITLADPVFAVRGRTAIPINLDFGAPYYRLNGMNGYNRNFRDWGGR